MSVEPQSDQTNGVIRDVSWTVVVPSLVLAYEIEGTQFVSGAVGTQLTHVHHQPFLDSLYGARAGAVAKVADAHGGPAETLDEAMRTLVSFGLGRDVVRRVSRGQYSEDDVKRKTAGAASEELIGSVAASANTLLKKLSESEVGGSIRWGAAIAAVVLILVTVAGGWRVLASALASVGAGALSSGVLVFLVSALAALGLLGFAYFRSRRRIAAVAGVAPARPKFGWQTWTAVGLVLIVAPVMHIALQYIRG